MVHLFARGKVDVHELQMLCACRDRPVMHNWLAIEWTLHEPAHTPHRWFDDHLLGFGVLGEHRHRLCDLCQQCLSLSYDVDLLQGFVVDDVR